MVSCFIDVERYDPMSNGHSRGRRLYKPPLNCQNLVEYSVFVIKFNARFAFEMHLNAGHKRQRPLGGGSRGPGGPS